MAGMGSLTNAEMAFGGMLQPSKHQHIYNFLKTAFENLDKDQRSLEQAALAGPNPGNAHNVSDRLHASDNLNQLSSYGGLQNFIRPQ